MFPFGIVVHHIMLVIYISEGKYHLACHLTPGVNSFPSVIICVRTWALWHLDTRVGIGILAMMVAGLIGHCVVMAKFNSSSIGMYLSSILNGTEDVPSQSYSVTQFQGLLLDSQKHNTGIQFHHVVHN
jgi:hypothetical protein